MIGFVTFLLTIVIVVLAILGVATGLRRIGGPEGRPDASSARLDRLETTLSSLESQVTELQEQQRFLERLLADRDVRGSIGAGRRPAAGRRERSGTREPGERSVLPDRDRKEER